MNTLRDMTFFDTFNNREKALAVWLLVFLFWTFTKKEVRTSALGVLKAMFLTKIAFVFLGMLIYVSVIILLLYKVDLWDFLLIKDTIYWILGTGFVLLVSVNKALQDKSHFRKILFDTLKLTIILEFIANLYAFGFWIEMLLMPLLFLIVAINAYSGIKTEYEPTKKLTNWILAVLGISMLLFAFSQILFNYHSLTTTYNLQTFILPPILTITFIPFLYIFTLVMAYENDRVLRQIRNKAES